MFMRLLNRALVCLALGIAVTLPALAAPPKGIESTPQAKALRANMKAVDAGDLEAYKKTMSSESLKQMDAQAREMKKTPKDLMEFVKMMSPTDVKLTDLKVAGKKATISMTGMSDGQMMKGTADMVEESGQWKVDKQAWSNTK
jgi:uncharacterized protein (DUF849 family)